MRKRGRRRNSRLRGVKVAFLLGLIFTMALILLLSTVGSQRFGSLHKLALESIGPFQKIAGGFSGYIRSLKDNYIDLIRVRHENERLWAELEESRNSAYKNREALATNARLRKLLELKESSDAPSVAAMIVGKDPSLWFRTVIIDRGSSDGVQKGMPVVTGAGIVGQIFTVAPHYSKVLLAITPSSAIDVVVQETRARGILKGTGSQSYRLEYIFKTAKINLGNHLVTAGHGGFFPPGLPVGVVTKVTQKRRGMFQVIEVTPSVDFHKLEELLVIQRKIPFME